MELLQLKYFQVVARMQHMTKASEYLKIAQPSLSKTISNLEKDLGVKLFDRKGKYIVLNEYGSIFLKRVDEALSAIDTGKKEICDLIEDSTYEVKLLVLACSSLIPDLLGDFRNINPNIRFKIFQTIPEGSTLDNFDLCLSATDTYIPKENSILLLDEEIFLAIPTNHKFTKLDSVSLKDVSKENFISLKKGKAFRDITDDFCQLCGFVPNIIFESDNPSTVRDFISGNKGIGFFPGISWRLNSNSDVKLISIKDFKCRRIIEISWNSSKYMSDIVRLFRDFTVDFFNSLRA